MSFVTSQHLFFSLERPSFGPLKKKKKKNLVFSSTSRRDCSENIDDEIMQLFLFLPLIDFVNQYWIGNQNNFLKDFS